MKNPKFFWYTIKRNGIVALTLSEEVHLIGLTTDGKRVEEETHNVFVPISEIVWNSRPSPLALRKAENYGDAFVNTVNRYPQLLNPPNIVKTKRYIPSAPPMNTLPMIEEVEESV